MTTAVTRPFTVTARIDTPHSNPAPAAYTVTVYMNTHRDNFDGYEPHHPLAAATRLDGSPLRLVFHASDRIHNHEAAAGAAFDVGNHERADDDGQTWPGDIIRSVSTGDVIKITGPDHWIVHLRVDPVGFSAVPEPTTLVDLAGTRATRRL
ncbi:hypothetical protein OG613_47290 (plasmid) [Streptomyces sp. NBC_00015]|uniref:hypothetical protein n=1 Tax=Streptomyces sp. NBC_00015 TaxID=2903611 RepID=UPI002F90F19F